MSTRDFDKVFIVPKLDEKDAERVALVSTEIKSSASEYGIDIVQQRHVDKKTLVVAVGGDGTMLEAMRIAAMNESIATGINLGKVGFLTDFASHDKLDRKLRAMFKDSSIYPIEERMSLRILTDISDLRNSAPVFNEYVFSNKLSDHLIKYRLRINDVDAGYHRANAVIVGTPTGSTAYTLSNGGGLLYPSMSVMQIVPVAPLSLSSRPIIVPGDAVVELTIETEYEWVIKGDGATRIGFGKGGRSIQITKYPHNTRILHTKDWNFFNMLSDKLHWKHL